MNDASDLVPSRRRLVLTKRPRKPSFLSVAVIFILCVVGLGACGGGAELKESLVDPAAKADPKDPAGRSSAGTGGDNDAEFTALVAALAPEDLGEGWEQCCPPILWEPDALGDHACSAPAGLPDFFAGFQRDYALNQTRNNEADAHIFGVALVSATKASADAEFASMRSEKYLKCRSRGVKEKIKKSQAAILAGRIENTSELIVVDQLPVPATLLRVHSAYPTRTGRGWVNTDILQMKVGKIIHRIQFHDYGKQQSPDFILCVASSVLERAEIENTNPNRGSCNSLLTGPKNPA